MVTEKDAAIKRVKRREEYRQRVIDELEANTIKFRWFVEEVTPAYDGDGFYGDVGTPARHVRVSEYFDSLEDAEKWLDRMEPDEGNTLEICRDRLLKQVTHVWTRG